MMRRFCTLEDRHATTMNLTRCGLRILAALALAFGLAGANPSWSAQAAPAIDNYDYVLTAIPSAYPICTGQSTLIRVSLSRQLKFGLGDAAPEMVSRAEVAALSNNNVGTITPDRMFIGHPSTFDPNSVLFRFTAGDDPGVAEIRFRFFLSSDLGGITIDKDFQFVVFKCSYKVNTFFVGLAPEIMSWAYAADETILNKDSDTQFSGSVPFHRVIKALFHDRGLGPGEILCSKKPYRLGKWTIKTEPTLIDYKADILVNGTLHLTTSLRNYKDIVSESCTGATSSSEQWLSSGSTPAIILSFPPEGGVAVVNGPVGDALFIVERVAIPEQ